MDIAKKFPPFNSGTPRRTTLSDDARRANFLLIHCLYLLTPWEQRFLESVAAWPGELSPRQEACLDKIWAGARRHG
jgi:hypothetical protein